VTVPIERAPISFESNLGPISYAVHAPKGMTRRALVAVAKSIEEMALMYGVPDAMHPNDIGEPTVEQSNARWLDPVRPDHQDKPCCCARSR
jgi:hypothetical protein